MEHDWQLSAMACGGRQGIDKSKSSRSQRLHTGGGFGSVISLDQGFIGGQCLVDAVICFSIVQGDMWHLFGTQTNSYSLGRRS